MTTEKNAVTHAYGDDSEETNLALICKPHSNSVSIFLGETDKSLKPKMQVTVTFTAGAAKAAVPGKTTVNELAGVPSFKASLPRPIRYSTRWPARLRSRSGWRRPSSKFR